MRTFLLTFLLYSAGGVIVAPLLNFSSATCQPCQQMAPVVAQVEAAGTTVQRADFDADKALVAQHKVTAVPTFIAIRDGKEVDRHVGVATYARLTEMAAKVAGAASRTAATTPMIVRVGTTKALGSASLGSGAIVDADGKAATVLTCWHIFRDGSTPWIRLHDGRTFKGRALKTDPENDLAAFEVDDPGVGVVGIAESEPAEGDWLGIYGFDGGNGLENYRGFLGQLRKFVSFRRNPAVQGGMVQWDRGGGEAIEVGVGVRGGDSGGPILNLDGHLVGTVTGTANGCTTGPCLPRLKAVLQKLGCNTRRWTPTPKPAPKPGCDPSNPNCGPDCQQPPTPKPAPILDPGIAIPAPPVGPIIVAPTLPPTLIPGPAGKDGRDGTAGLPGKDGINGKDADPKLVVDLVLAALKDTPITVSMLNPDGSLAQPPQQVRLGGELQFMLEPVQ